MSTSPAPCSDPQPRPKAISASRLIVCERKGTWAVALRRHPALGELRVYETRTLADAWQMLASHPSSFLVVEMTHANIDGLLELLKRVKRQYPRVRTAVVTEPPLADYQWLLREAGAVHFVFSRRATGPLALIAHRHLTQAPEPRRSITERIWAGLPWTQQFGALIILPSLFCHLFV
ncbi:MAG: hypothetical protein GXY83_01480 [Rhodopirellula sp.]|nr:hypothetical protein [Rhodopirellula sp.]